MENKSKIYSPKHLKELLIVGLVLMAAGAIAGYLLPDEAHLATSIAGMASGVGSSFALIGGVFLLRRWRLGEARARDAELAMTDEVSAHRRKTEEKCKAPLTSSPYRGILLM